MTPRKLLVALAAGACFAAATTASAVPVLQIQAGALPSVTVVDQGAGDVNPTLGAVTFIGSLGAWTVNVVTGLGSPAPNQPKIDLNSINVSTFPGGGSGSIVLMLSERDLTVSALPSLLSFVGDIGGTTEGTLAWSMYVDDGNALFGLSQLIGMGVATTPNGVLAFADSFAALRSITDTFSMTLRVVVTHGDGTHNSSFNFSGSMVPEPATLMLLGVGLMALALARRRRAR